jgi:hypothetical protein
VEDDPEPNPMNMGMNNHANQSRQTEMERSRGVLSLERTGKVDKVNRKRSFRSENENLPEWTRRDNASECPSRTTRQHIKEKRETLKLIGRFSKGAS